MKRIFQTFWTKPMTGNRLEINVHIALLSLCYAKASGYYVVMYTDTLGYSYLKDFGYDEINTYLDEIPDDIKPNQYYFFAYPKFFAGLKEPLGSLHIDFDVFLKKPCVDVFFEDKSIDVILQCKEGYASYFYLYVKGRKKILSHKYPETLKINHLNSSNVGIIGFNNQELKDIYFSWYFDYIDFYKTRTSYLKCVSSEMFVEQVNIDYLLETKNYKCHYLLIKDTGENHDELRAFADKIGYQHLQGIEKYKRKDTLPNIYNILRKKFPNEFTIIRGLFNEDN